MIDTIEFGSETVMNGRNFSLTDRLSDFIDREVTSGRHQNASEVVREAQSIASRRG